LQLGQMSRSPKRTISSGVAGRPHSEQKAGCNSGVMSTYPRLDNSSILSALYSDREIQCYWNNRLLTRAPIRSRDREGAIAQSETDAVRALRTAWAAVDELGVDHLETIADEGADHEAGVVRAPEAHIEDLDEFRAFGLGGWGDAPEGELREF
jgi:hypothetical protein